jgi:DNA invertase Pin-like site-specific DNA recombinase
MAAVGYARVSTRDQNLDGQTGALQVAGREKVFIEHTSSVLAKRTALDDALSIHGQGRQHGAGIR